MPKSAPATTTAKGKDKSKSKNNTQPKNNEVKTRKPTRRSPYHRDASNFRKAQRSVKSMTPKSVLRALIVATAEAVCPENKNINIQGGVVEAMDGLLDQYLHSLIFAPGAIVRASGGKRVSESQLLAFHRYNRNSGRGPRWNSRAIRNIREQIGLE